ncbi:MAG: hypothetical protein WC843_04305 [Candidatus Gracilibacteria bacterium]|jgi:hypothetical protein
MKINNKFLQLKNCIPGADESLVKRAVFEEGKETSKQKAPEGPKDILDSMAEQLMKIPPGDAEVNFDKDPKKIEETLRNLAKKAYKNALILADPYYKDLLANFEEQGKNKGTSLTLNQYWKELGEKNVSKIILKNGRISFEKNDKSSLTWESFAIVPKLPHPPTQESVGEKGKKVPEVTTTKSREKPIVVNNQNRDEVTRILKTQLKDGDKIKVLAPSTETKSYFLTYKNGKFVKRDGTEVPLLADTTIIYTAQTEKTPEKGKITVDQKNEDNAEYQLFKNHEIVGKFKIKPEIGQTLEKALRDAINPNEKVAFKNYPKIQKLRDLNLKYEDYFAFLSKEKALRSDNTVYLLIPKEKDIPGREDKQEKEGTARRQGENQKIAQDREKYFFTTNFREGETTFQINDPKIVEALDDKEKWAEVWANGAIAGIRALKGIIMDEPIFEHLKKDPDKLRTAINKTITKGSDENFTTADLVNILMKEAGVRMPSYSAEKVPFAMDQLNGEEKFSDQYSPFHNPEYQGDTLTARHLAMGFLTKLGAYENAKLSDKYREKGGAAMVVDFEFENHLYRAKINNEGKIVIYNYPGGGLYVSQNGYSNEKTFNEAELVSGDRDPNSNKNTIAKWFRDAVTPLINYDNAKAEFDRFYQGAFAKPEYASRPDILNFYKNLVIGTTKLGLGLKNMQLDERALQESRALRSRPEHITDYSPENLQLRQYIQNVFPDEIGDRSWNDVLEQVDKKYDAKETLMHMNGSYANAKFKEMVEKAGGLKNGKLDQTIVFNQFRNLLQTGLSRLRVLYPNDTERQQVEAELQGLLGITKDQDGVYDVSKVPDYQLVGLLGHPQENQAIFKMIQKGLVLDLAQKEDLRKTDVNKKYAEALTNYYKFPEADRQNFENAIRKHYIKQGLKGAELEKEVKTTVSKAIPVIPVVGYDANTKTLGLGIALNFPVELGENGKYGTLFLGGGTGLGIGLKTGEVGAAVGTGAGYETAPIGHIGNVNFSIIGGASLGFGVSEEGLKLGGGAGLALGIDLGTDSSGYKHKVSVGIVATNFGLLPGVVYGYKKNHEYKMREALDDGLKAFGFTNIDLITDPRAKTIAIMRNPRLRSAILQQDRTALNDQEKILIAYNNLRKDLVQTVQENYDPTGFNGASFGFGLTNEGKFVFGISPDFTLSDDRKSYFRSDKSTEQMESEIDREQLISILNKKTEDRNDEEKRILFLNEKSGNIAAGIEGRMVLVKDATKPLQTAPIENIDSIQKLEVSLNALYEPLRLKVQYDPTKKLFELLIPHDEKRNFELAVDPAMAKGGIVFEGGRVFLASDFKPENPLTIKRSNFEYPFPKEAGASFVSIITISDQPNTPGMEIYRQAPRVLVSTRGEGWKPETGFHPQTTDCMLTDAAASGFKIDDGSFKKFEARKNSAGTEKNINTFKQTIGKIDESKYQDYVKFAQDFEKANKKDYRRLSNKETDSADYKELTTKINKDWAEKHNRTNPNLAELNLIRGLLVDESFTELDKIKDPKARQAAFLDQLKRTRKTTEKRFKDVVERNQAKYPKAEDPRRINSAPELLSAYALDRVKGVDINSDTGAVNVKEVDRFLSMASTEGERGFRGTLYTKDEDQDKKLLGGVEYSKALQTPNTIEADMAKFVMESFSPMEAMAEDKGDFNSQEKIKNLLSNPLTLQITGLLENPATQGLFSKDEYRDIVIDIVANQKTALNTDEVKAAQELYKLLEGIRKAQAEGKEAYLDPKHPDFRFVWKLETFDGVYKKCTNYSNWINEKLGLEIRTEQVGAFAGYAGQGTSVAEASSTTQHNTLTLGFAAGIAGKPEGPKGEIIPPPTGIPPGKKVPTNNPIVGDTNQVAQGVDPSGKVDTTKKYE